VPCDFENNDETEGHASNPFGGFVSTGTLLAWRSTASRRLASWLAVGNSIVEHSSEDAFRAMVRGCRISSSRRRSLCPLLVSFFGYLDRIRKGEKKCDIWY
jgi:hypothetical protein